ncbi:hypothetical protein TKK_0005066 [Trichogramma kaykai]|uniref:Uncharacterized protein n=1 Tax=Trichogramma kaykai TaxID=54128 RepID=A0ABD2XJ12_9HYME
MIEVFAIPSRGEYQAEEQDSPFEEIMDLEMIQQLEPIEDSWAINENDHVVHLDKDCSLCSDIDIGSEDTWSVEESDSDCAFITDSEENVASESEEVVSQKSWEINTEWKKYFV